MVKIMKKEERIIMSNVHHPTIEDTLVSKMEKLLLKTGTELQLIMEVTKLDHTVADLF